MAEQPGLAGQPGPGARVRTLNTGYPMPLLGLGTYPLMLDTAAKYGNEAAVGEAIRQSGVPRGELFVTTKLRGADHGRARTRAGLCASLGRLGLDYADLFLIHWPLPMLGRYVESWEVLLECAAEGLIRSAGVSNFTPAHIGALVGATGVRPAVDQIELSPALARRGTRRFLDAEGIAVQAWGPLGLGHRVPEAGVVTRARPPPSTPTGGKSTSGRG
jgi:2,5-diketo-D-gluconate reductase A